MQFESDNKTVKRCAEGMELEDEGKNDSVKAAYPSLYLNIAKGIALIFLIYLGVKHGF
ncbi:hypothetical protein [Mucilaginibacter sp.]